MLRNGMSRRSHSEVPGLPISHCRCGHAPQRRATQFPLPRRANVAGGEYTLPPLLKAYLRLGAQIGGEPCLDPDFNVADVFVLLATRRIERRYARHFLDRDQ